MKESQGEEQKKHFICRRWTLEKQKGLTKYKTTQSWDGNLLNLLLSGPIYQLLPI
jgi:hypothetical protein